MRTRVRFPAPPPFQDSRFPRPGRVGTASVQLGAPATTRPEHVSDVLGLIVLLAHDLDDLPRSFREISILLSRARSDASKRLSVVVNLTAHWTRWLCIHRIAVLYFEGGTHAHARRCSRLAVPRHLRGRFDGVLEINQACAEHTGCFPGDDPGFPVSITGAAGRNYRLTSDLNLAGVPDNISGIIVGASFVTVNLGGFTIEGTSSCTGTGASISCGPTGSGSGVLFSGVRGTTVRNGRVIGMTSTGVGGDGGSATVENILAFHNRRDGIGVGDDSIVRNSISQQNGQDGFQLGSGSVVDSSTAQGNGFDGVKVQGPGAVVSDTVARGNGFGGYNLDHTSRFTSVSYANGQPDSCGGGICTPSRRFYLTAGTHDGANALSACDDGFHMASLPELFDQSNFVYDSARSSTYPPLGDTGSGPPRGAPASGWIRTGDDAHNLTGTAGFDNCLAWSTTSGEGMFGILDESPNSNLEYTSQWRVGNGQCASPRSVWCIEDR